MKVLRLRVDSETSSKSRPFLSCLGGFLQGSFCQLPWKNDRPVVVKDSFLRGSPIFSRKKAANRFPGFLERLNGKVINASCPSPGAAAQRARQRRGSCGRCQVPPPKLTQSTDCENETRVVWLESWNMVDFTAVLKGMVRDSCGWWCPTPT